MFDNPAYASFSEQAAGIGAPQTFSPYDVGASSEGGGGGGWLQSIIDAASANVSNDMGAPYAGAQTPTDYISGEPTYTDYGSSPFDTGAAPVDYTGGLTDYSGGGYTDPGYTDMSYAGDVSAGDFATGGRFTVPGSAGAKVPVRMNAHAGEEVSVAPINRRPWDGEDGRDRGSDAATEVRKIGDANGRVNAEALHFHIYGDGGGSSGALPRGMSRAALARDFRRALAMA
jgi:hypothetical protein